MRRKQIETAVFARLGFSRTKSYGSMIGSFEEWHNITAFFYDGILRPDSKRNKQFKFDGKFPIPKNIYELERNSTRTTQPNIQPLLFQNPRTASESNLAQRICVLSVDCSILIGNIYPRCRPPRRRRQRNNRQQFDLRRFLMRHFGREVSYSRFAFPQL